MLKGLVACIVLFGATFPAFAGDRPVAKARALASLPKAEAAATRRDKPVSGRTIAQPFMLPAGTPRLQRPLVALGIERTSTSTNTVASAAWGPGSTLPQVTASAGGSYAVYDVMRAQPRPRHRNSPLGAALVLRLDGQEESPAFSIGGGGVAAAVWRAVPR